MRNRRSSTWLAIWTSWLVALALVVCPLSPAILLATAVADAHTNAGMAARTDAGDVAPLLVDVGTDEDVALVVVAAPQPIRASVRAASDAPVPLFDLTNFSRIGQVASAIALPRSIADVCVIPPPPLAEARPETRAAPTPIAPDDAPPPPLRGPPAAIA